MIVALAFPSASGRVVELVTPDGRLTREDIYWLRQYLTLTDEALIKIAEGVGVGMMGAQR